MSDGHFVRPDDFCQVNPINCPDGLSFSIWEKIEYDDNILVSFSFLHLRILFFFSLINLSSRLVDHVLLVDIFM